MAARRAQTAVEYAFIIASVIVIIALVLMLLRGNVIFSVTSSTQSSVQTLSNYTRSFLFFDNFDAGTASQWTPASGEWSVQDKEYVQSKDSQAFKVSMAGDASWYNYVAETEFRRTSFVPSLNKHIAGISARADPYSLARYACMVGDDLKLRLLKFTGEYSSEELEYAFLSEGDLDGMHRVGIGVIGHDVYCFYDGVRVIVSSDDLLVDGGIALESYKPAVFDNVRVWNQGGPIPTYAPLATPTTAPTAEPSVPAWPDCIASGGSCMPDQCNHFDDCVDKPGFACAVDGWCCEGSCVPSPTPTMFPEITGVGESGIAWGCLFNYTFTWTTDVSATSDVAIAYNGTGAFLINYSEAYPQYMNLSLVTDHAFVVYGLLENMPYKYRVWSCGDNVTYDYCNASIVNYFSTPDVLGCGYGGGSPLLVPLLKSLADATYTQYCNPIDPFCWPD
ncbi:MAG: hypothetical protein V1787_00325 [Candidatus Micrarchaeota archaeon]